MQVQPSKRLLSVGEAAARLGVSPASLRSWSDRGLVASYRTPGRQRRYSHDDLERFIESMRQPVSSDARVPRPAMNGRD
jgi:excisionase family DNA binding protein